ncbi:MAG: hypothetical protein EOO86_17795 [Pedobacter sp.]|nr:MAG: hypothetical protein EOO86_17795 [Pedobacter sp.]
MKTLNAFLLFFVSNLCVAQQGRINIDLEETEYVYATGKTCAKKTGQPLNGNYAIKFNRYQTNYETFLDGLKNGEFKVFRNKKLSEKGMYQNNLKEKEWLYYNEDGTIKRRSIFESGLQEGIEIFYDKGRIEKTSTFSKTHLHGWQIKYSASEANEIFEKSLYAKGQKVKLIRYKNINNLKFIISDSLVYNDLKQLISKKSFVNDSLLLQYKISYNVIIKDAYQINTTKIEIIDEYNSNIAYLLPERDRYETQVRLDELLNYKFAYYTDVKKPRLLVSDLTRNDFYTSTFYRLYRDVNR